MKISIITASDNYEKYIKETIESVLNQTYTNWEMIIVDDGSKDNSVEIIKEFCQKDDRIKLFQHDNGINKGLAETLKLGISKAQSDWIVFLESDDTITKEYLEEKIKVIENNEDTDLIFNDINLFGDEEKIKNFENGYFIKQKKQLKKIGHKQKIIKLFKNKKNENFIPTFSVVMVRKKIIENLNFDSPNKPALDFFLWIQIAKDYNYYYIDKKLTNWRMHKNSYISHNVDNKDLKNFIKIRNKYIHRKSYKLLNFKIEMNNLRRKIIQIHTRKNEIIILQKFQFKDGIWKINK